MSWQGPGRKTPRSLIRELHVFAGCISLPSPAVQCPPRGVERPGSIGTNDEYEYVVSRRGTRPALQVQFSDFLYAVKGKI